MMKKIFSILTLFVTLVAITSCSEDDNTPALSSLNSITSFKINFEGVNEDEITYDLGNEITVSVPFKTELKGLKPIIEVSENATVSPASGEAVDFEDGVAKPFVVTAEDETTKTYNVTINVRAEVGSGTQLKSVEKDDSIFGVSTTTYEYTSSNFVSKYSFTEEGNTTEFVYLYDDKNQITELKNETDNLTTAYTYNADGQITGATTKKEDDTLVYTYTYTYNAEGQLEKTVRVDEQDANQAETVYTFTYDNGNVIKETVGNEEYEATYDDKNNPFKGIYPAAYAAIQVGIESVGMNNPNTGTFADAGTVAYTYNTDDYPLTLKYTYFGFANVTKTFTYN